jgi:SAM-dependent methyltransferase
MRAQRPAGLAEAVDAAAEDLPFADSSFDAAMTTFSVHQWSDLRAGLREIRRVTRGPVVILTCDPDLLRPFWLSEYAPEVIDAEARRYPSIEALAGGLGGRSPRRWCRCRWTVPTGSTRPTTAGLKRSLTRPPGSHARRGVSSARPCTSASPAT